MEASDRNCPHCGYALADGATNCPCGLALDDMNIPGPGIVRDSLEQKLTLKSGADGSLEEIEVDEVVPARNSAERKKGREGRESSSDSSGSSASGDTPRAADRSRPAEEKKEEPAEEKDNDEDVVVELTSELETERDSEPVPARPKPADKSTPLRAVREASGRQRKNMIMACPSCSARISKRAPKCPKCGQSPYRSCQICAALILVNSAACGECGDPDPFLAQSA